MAVSPFGGKNRFPKRLWREGHAVQRAVFFAHKVIARRAVLHFSDFM